MKKRGQATLFIILGIVLVIIIFLLIFFRSSVINILPSSLSLPKEVADLELQIKNCLDLSSERIIKQASLQAGYTNPPQDSYEVEELVIPHGIKNGKNVLISEERMLLEIANELDLDIEKCIPESNLEIILPETKSKIEITLQDELTKIKINYQIMVSKGDKAFNLENPITINSNLPLKQLHDAANTIIETETDIDITSLLDTGIDVSILPLDNNTIAYALEKDDLIFMFASK